MSLEFELRENLLQIFYKFLIILAPIFGVLMLFLIWKTIFYIMVLRIIYNKKFDKHKLSRNFNLFLESDKLYKLLLKVEDVSELDFVLQKNYIQRLNPHNFDIDYQNVLDSNIEYDGLSICSDNSVDSVDSNEIEKCSICLSNINNYIYTELYCTHKFHLKCLNEWVKNSNECPLCKREILEQV